MRKPTPQARPRLDDLPTRELIARGAALASTHDYKDAIEVYKLLLKREPQAEAGWRDSLATAYVERAKQLAGKAMYREAAILWENIPHLCGQTRQPELYVDWLLRSGQHAKAVNAYGRYAAALSGAGELETLLAALALTGQKDVVQAIPAEAPLRRQLAAAQAALRAYCQGEAEAAVREYLQNIPVRSPYRDLRQTLAALLKLETDPADAEALVERIPLSSPYQTVVELIRAAAAREPARTLLALDPTQRELASGLLGLDQRQLKLLRDWARLDQKPGDKTRLEFISANLALFDGEQAARAALTLLPAYPQGSLAGYFKLLDSLPPFERHRLHALRAERERELDGALLEWRIAADLLIAAAKNADSRLSAALILRRMAELSEKVKLPWSDSPKTIEYLEESLRYDPDDRDAYLKLARLHQADGNDKEYHQWVERAVKQFPDDPQALLAAVETATARKAYKKAAGFAARVLELDPINSKARTFLINAHLAHARKQILAGKHALAEKELDSAGQLERDNARSGIVEFNRSFLAFHQLQPERMRQWLREGARLAGSPVLAWTRLAVESLRLDLEPETFERDLQLGDPRKFAVSRADLLALTQLINAYREEGVKALDTVLEDLEKPLKRAIKPLTDINDLLAVCECLHQAPHYELLEYAATGALATHPNRPLFTYYQIYARGGGDIDEISERDYDRLENALHEAANANDHRTATLIERFLAEDRGMFPFPAPRGRPSSPMELMDDMMEEIRDDLDRMPPRLRDKMLDKILDSLPPDDAIPPELGKKLLKALLLGEGLDDLRDLPDFPLPLGGGDKRKKRRS